MYIFWCNATRSFRMLFDEMLMTQNVENLTHGRPLYAARSPTYTTDAWRISNVVRQQNGQDLGKSGTICIRTSTRTSQNDNIPQNKCMFYNPNTFSVLFCPSWQLESILTGAIIGLGNAKQRRPAIVSSAPCSKGSPWTVVGVWQQGPVRSLALVRVPHSGG